MPEPTEQPTQAVRALNARWAWVLAILAAVGGAVWTFNEFYVWDVMPGDLAEWRAPLTLHGDWSGRLVRLTYHGLGERHAKTWRMGREAQMSFVLDESGKQREVLVIVPTNQLPTGRGPFSVVGRIYRQSTAGVILWQIGPAEEAGAFCVNPGAIFRLQGAWGPLILLGGTILGVCLLWLPLRWRRQGKAKYGEGGN
jgi:YD repeat-containing protein